MLPFSMGQARSSTSSMPLTMVTVLRAWPNDLLQIVTEIGRIVVGIEARWNAAAETLLPTEASAVFVINPKQLDRFRDRFTTSGAKDDRRDALRVPETHSAPTCELIAR